MNRILIASLIVAAAVLPALAQSDADIFHKGSYRMGYADLNMDKSRGQVLEYDGKNYKSATGDIELGNKIGDMIFDFNLKDIGSNEENGTLTLNYGSGIRANASYNAMHHRQNYRRNGVDINGVWTYNPNIIMAISTGTDLMFKRTEEEFNLARVSPENSANWLSAQYWTATKKGQTESRYANYNVAAAEVNNVKQDLTLGFGAGVTEKGALSVDLINSKFEDRMTQVSTAPTISPYIQKPRTGTVSMIAGESKFRYAASNKLSITGAVTTRKRVNETTNYTAKSGVGALNLVYQFNQKLSLAAKLYSRWSQVGENASYVSPNPAGGNPSRSLAEMNKVMFRGDLKATYRATNKLTFKGGYNTEFNNRRNTEDLLYLGTKYYFDGVKTVNIASPWAKSDTRRLATVGAKWELPFDIEAEADYKNLDANHPVFVNQSNKSDESNLTVTIPLPFSLSCSLAGKYLTERNNESVFSNFHQDSRNYMAGLEWTPAGRISAGGDFSFEKTNYYTNMWSGTGTSNPVNIATGTYHQYGVNNRQENQVIGLHTTADIGKGLLLTGNGSYTWSKITTPFGYYNTVNNYAVTDFTPGDVRITRAGLALAYSPASHKDITVRAGYTYQEWVDKNDSYNSGRANIANASVAAKF